MKTGFYGAAIAAVAGLAMGGLLKGPFSAEAAPEAPPQVLVAPQTEPAAYEQAPQYYAPAAYTYAEAGGGDVLRAGYEADPIDALLQPAAYREAVDSPDAGRAASAAAERASNEAYAAGMTTPAVRPAADVSPPPSLADSRPDASAQDFESIDALIGAMKPGSTGPA